MRVRTWGGSVAAVAAALAVAVPAQAAGLGVKAAVVKQDRVARHSAALKQLGHTTLGSFSNPRKVIPEYRALARVLDRAATAVSRSTATTPSQRLGRRDWVMGARLEARAVNQLVVAFGDIEHGNRTAAAREARTAETGFKRGGAHGVKADRLLGLPKTD